MNIQNVLQHCQQMQAEGKSPSLGLLKARMGKGISMPILIQGLQAWRNGQQANIDAKKTLDDKVNTPPSTEQRVAALEQQVTALLARVAVLESK